MAVAGVLATQLTTHAARTKALFVGGVDVMFQPGAGGNRMGVPIETVHVTEAGPGGVSSMEFVIDDPGITVSVQGGMEVRFQDITNNYPIFLGYVQSYSAHPDFGQQGRKIEVTCIGIEAVLDWSLLTTDLTWAASYIQFSTADSVIQSIVANCIGTGPLRAFYSATTTTGNQAFPMFAYDISGSNVDPLTVTAGTSLREAIRQVYTACDVGPDSSGNDWNVLNVTVDFYYGLRVYSNLLGNRPDDYTNQSVGDVPTSPDAASGIAYSVDVGGVVRGVYVRGSTPSIAVTVMDRTGLPGPINYLSDSSITTVASARAAATAYLFQFKAGLRGSYQWPDIAPKLNFHPTCVAVITDVALGLAGEPTQVMQIDKTFNPSGRENWTVAFGGLPPSGAALIRRLTRGTLS